MRPLVALAFLLSTAPLVCADIGPKPRRFGPGVQPTGDLAGLSVEMTAEEVDLVLSQQGGTDTLSVEATFRMTNLASETQRFEIGFPAGPVFNMEGFSASQGGEPVDAKLIDRRQDGRELTAAEARKAPGGDFWYVWDARFPPGESVHVVRYRITVWHFSEYRSCGYLLHTGAPWKNAIGKAVVRLRCQGDLSLDHVSALGPRLGGEREGDAVVWTFTDLEPTAEHDIRIEYNTARTFEEELARHQERAQVHFQAKCEVVFQLQRAPQRHLRAVHDDAELGAYLRALRDLLSEARAEGERLVLPKEEPANVHYPEDMPAEVKAMLQARTGKETRRYARRGEGPEVLLRFFDLVVSAAATNPSHPQVRPTLEPWIQAVERFLAGQLFAGDVRLELAGDADERVAALEAGLAKARSLLADRS